jgi:hypothetical protein
MFKEKLLKVCTFGLYKGMKKKKENYFIRATKEDNNVNPIYLFLLIVLVVGIILLIVPVIGMLVDIFYNHTMTINLSDMALYVGAVAAMFTGGGAAGAITEYSYSKFNVKPLDEDGREIKDENHNGIPDDEEDDIDPEEELVIE